MALASAEGLRPDREFWNPRVEVMSREELKALQFKKLKKQLKYNYENSIFYKRSFDDAGIKPGDIRSWDDFALVPTMTKDDQRRCQEESLERFGHPYGVLVCAPMNKIVRNSATSGTTGTPTLYTLTKHDVQVIRELSARKFWRMGLRPGDRVLHAMALSMFTGGVPVCDTLQEYGVCVIPVGSESGIRRVLQFIELCKPHYIRCTPSTAEHLVRKCPEILGKQATALGLKGMLMSGESGGGVLEVRKRIKDGFGLQYLFDNIGGSHVFQAYSCSQTADSLDYKGMHLVSEDHCILELLDPVTKKPLDLTEGVTGEMVYTYIDWEGTPLLRYRLGDMLTVSFKPCECGDPRMRFNIIGRADDMLIVKGINLYPEALKKVVLAFLPRVTGEVRILLDAPGPKVEPPLKIQVEYGQEVSKADLALLDREMKDQIRSLLRINPDIEFLPPNTFELKEQKTRLVIKRYEQHMQLKTATSAGEAPRVESPRNVSEESISMSRAHKSLNPGTNPLSREESKGAATVDEVNLVCMSGQGSVQTMELMAAAFFEQHHKYVGSVVFPGKRSKSTPVVSYLKVSEAPITSTATNFEPSVVMVYWDGLMRVAAMKQHNVVRDAIFRLRRGVLIVNTTRAPEEIDIPFEFEGTVATVDASGIALKHLKRNPPPVGITLLGAYIAVTGALDMDTVMRQVQQHFRGSVGANNIAAAREAHDCVRILKGVKGRATSEVEEQKPLSLDVLRGVEPLGGEIMPGYRDGSPFIWRDKVPVCDDAKCLCDDLCLSEALCPDATGFIVRKGIENARQGYRIDVDYCRGCAVCVDVCVFGALKMISEEELLRTNPGYAGISVAPYRNEPVAEEN
jgi:phenylacetate-CoA ligase